MKEMVRALGIDDGPFDFSDRATPVVGVVMRPGYIDGVVISEAEVDGRDATGRVVSMVEGSRFREQVKTVMVDGIALGGFNVVDLEEVNRRTGVPVISVTRDRPDLEAMRAALKRKFTDWEWRWEVIDRGDLLVIDTGHKPIHVKAVGLDEREVGEVIRRFIVRGALPEPIRVAHLIATALVKGESRGKA